MPVIKQPLNSFGTWMVCALAELDLRAKGSRRNARNYARISIVPRSRGQRIGGA